MPAHQEYDLTSATFVENPYPTFAALQQDAPVYRCSRTGVWYLTRYRDIVEVFRSATATVVPPERLIAGLPEGEQRPLRSAMQVLRRMTLFREPPEQTWLHRALSRPILPRNLGEMKRRIDRIVGELLDEVGERSTLNAIDDFAMQLPITVIAELLGADPADRPLFRRWAFDIMQLVGVPTDSHIARRVRQSCDDAVEYFRPLLARCTAARDEGEIGGALLRELVAARDRYPQLSDDDLLASCVLLIMAGHETTTNLIANGLVCLLRNPDQMTRLRKDSSLTESAVEECLRYEAPIQRTSRILQEPHVIGGITIPAGSPVFLVLAAANRDPEFFPDPDRFDIGRRDGAPLSFGYGRHQCTGNALAIMEGRAAIAALLHRFDDIRLVESPRWDYNLVVRRLQSLRVAVRIPSRIADSPATLTA